MNQTSTDRMPTLYIPHGGGPCFFMDVPPGMPADMWDRMGDYLRNIGPSLEAKPKAVLVISAHWEAPRPTLNTARQPSLLFDYYGFPEHTYQLTYPAAGSPELAARVRELLGEAGIESGSNDQRGLDHGVFVPFKLIYPEADIPIVEMSLQQGLDPAEHLAIGRALAPLRDEGVLIVGSGMSFHNLRTLLTGDGHGDDAAEAFDSWLAEAATAPDVETRDRLLASWSEAPGARASHPREEHLLPLMVAAGAAGEDRGRRTYSEKLLGKALSGFQFG
ncbi:MAG: class III extradiol ring-cleavage dioxygenase [Acidihalobacter sp.]